MAARRAYSPSAPGSYSCPFIAAVVFIDEGWGSAVGGADPYRKQKRAQVETKGPRACFGHDWLGDLSSAVLDLARTGAQMPHSLPEAERRLGSTAVLQWTVAAGPRSWPLLARRQSPWQGRTPHLDALLSIRRLHRQGVRPLRPARVVLRRRALDLLGHPAGQALAGVAVAGASSGRSCSPTGNSSASHGAGAGRFLYGNPTSVDASSWETETARQGARQASSAGLDEHAADSPRGKRTWRRAARPSCRRRGRRELSTRPVPASSRAVRRPGGGRQSPCTERWPLCSNTTCRIARQDSPQPPKLAAADRSPSAPGRPPASPPSLSRTAVHRRPQARCAGLDGRPRSATSRKELVGNQDTPALAWEQQPVRGPRPKLPLGRRRPASSGTTTCCQPRHRRRQRFFAVLTRWWRSAERSPRLATHHARERRQQPAAPAWKYQRS